MGTCLPEAVLRQLAKTQSQIDSLTLTTDSRCDRWPQDNAALVDKLVNLEHLCWTGPPDLAALAALLIPRDRGPDRGSALSSLGLSWTTRDAYQHARDRGLGFARQVWIDPLRARGVAPRPPRSFHMPWLRRLSLYRVPVARDLFSHILDLDALQSLSLRDCPRWHLAMNHAVDRGARPFSLQTLEIKSSASVCLHKRQSAEQRRWLGFLDHIVAVDDVFCFEVVCRDVVADLWHHFSRLGDLASSHVLHYRAANRAESPYAALDLADLGMVHQDMTLLHDPFANSACRSLGVSCDPHYLRAFLQAFVAKDTLELVHIRQSFRDIELVGSWSVRSPLPYNGVPKYACQHVLQRSLLGFVEWAFGDEGISSLQVIIIGDYAHGDCILEHNFIMVRDEHEDSGFRLVDVREDESALVFHENRRLIGACPVTLPPTAAAELKQERDGAGLAYWPPGSSQRQPVAEFDDDDDDDDPDTADDQDQPTEEEAEADEAASDDATEESGDGSDETNPDGPEAHESSDEPDDDESEQTEAED